jgi:zinc D-Ala-D-Ala dipeptidase
MHINSKSMVYGVFFLLMMFIQACFDTKKKEKKSAPQIKPKKVIIADIGPKIEQSMINQGLLDIQSIDSSILVDLKYSSEDNFFGKDVYGSLTKAYLQKIPTEKLAQAQKNLKKINPNYSLIVYDAARPLRVQKYLWNSLDSIPAARRKDYVADPAEGSIHNYGSAVDLSIYDLEKKEALDMGTKYDFFGDLAYPRLESKMLKSGQLKLEQIENRRLLRTVMKKVGFMEIDSEWWHFNFYSRKKAKQIYSLIP